MVTLSAHHHKLSVLINQFVPPTFCMVTSSAHHHKLSVLINQFAPPTFCSCFAFIGKNFWGMLHHICDMACDKNMCGPIRTCKCRSPTWLINYMLNGNAKCQVMWTYHKYFSKPCVHVFSYQFKCCSSQIN